TSVLIAPRRGNGIQLAQQVATLDQLSNGRLVLGVGLGEIDAEDRAAGVPAAGRGRRLEATIAEMRRMWSGATPSAASTSVLTLPSGGPDIIVGGHSAPALRRAAAYEGWLCGNSSPAGFAQGAEEVRRAWHDAGRAGSPRFVCTQYFGLGDGAAAK